MKFKVGDRVRLKHDVYGELNGELNKNELLGKSGEIFIVKSIYGYCIIENPNNFIGFHKNYLEGHIELYERKIDDKWYTADELNKIKERKKKVYIVMTHGFGDQYNVEKVFKTKELAENYCKRQKGMFSQSLRYTIEEHNVSDNELEKR